MSRRQPTYEELTAPCLALQAKLAEIDNNNGPDPSLPPELLAEKAVQESERRFRRFVESCRHWFWEIDAGGGFVYSSPQVFDVLGYSVEEVLGRTMFAFMPADGAQQLAGMLAEIFASKAPFLEVESNYQHKNGNLTVLEIILNPVLDNNGNLLGWAGAGRNISKWQQDRDALEFERKQFVSIFDSINEAIYVSDPDSYEILYANKSLRNQLGQVTGEKCYAALQGRESPCPFCTNDKIFSDQTGEPYIWECQNLQNHRWYRCIDRAIRWPDNRRVRYEMAIDITENKLTEDMLRKYEHIVSASDDYMSSIGLDYTYLAVNDTYLRAFGKNREEIVGCSWADLHGRERFEQEFKQKLDICFAGKKIEFRAWFNFPCSGLRYLDIRYYPYFNQDKAVSSVIVNARDITEREQLELRLRQAQKQEALGTLAGGIAHDFNNILGVIIGCTELALMDIHLDEDLAACHLGKVLNAGKRAKELVRQILTFNRQPEEGNKPTKIIPIIKECLKMMRATLPATIEIRQHFEIEDDIVLADPTRFFQIVMNLCTNAAHAMKAKGGVLEVALTAASVGDKSRISGIAASEKQYLKLSITDSGHGIDPEVLERIFDPYFTTKDIGVGTGLGLALVQGAVKSCGGEIFAHSIPGKGSVFEIFLPRFEAYKLADAVPGGQGKLPGGVERILVVDDEAFLAENVSARLEHLGYHVVAATSSSSALKIFQEKADFFDLVLTDQTMPDMTGLELAQHLKTIRPEIKIILCTGFSESITQEEINRAGVNKYIMKPLTAQDLALAVRHVLDGRWK